VKTIVYLHHNPDVYGSSRSLERIVRTLDKTEFKPIVLLPYEGPLRGLLEAAGAEVRVVSCISVIERQVFHSFRLVWFVLTLPIRLLQLAVYLRHLQADLVHTNTGLIVSGAAAAFIAGVPHVWHIRDWFQEFSGLWKFYVHYIMAFSRKVVCVSHSTAEQFPAHPKVQVISNGFSPEEFPAEKRELRPVIRNNLGMGANADRTFVVGTVGRIKLLRKGQEFLLEAVAILKKRGLNVACIIVGAPYKGYEDHLDIMKEQVRVLGVEREIHWIGEVPDPAAYYLAMDCFVLTSAQPEPFGRVIGEAMGWELPVIATNFGGPLELVLDGVTGFHFPPGNARALADKIELLMNDRPRAKAMGIAGRDHLFTRFSLGVMVENLQRCYREALASSS
jgi:glycosyltransferase involved in cell wall biosynthesis